MLWVKMLWLLPKVWMAMRKIGTPEDIGVSRDRIPANLIILYGSTHYQPRWWVESYSFLYHHACVVELRQIFYSGGTPGQDLIKLGMQTLLDLWVLSE